MLLDRSSATPLYRQIALALRDEIRGGHRPLGSSLPTVRDMSRELGVAHLTVVRAYDELQAMGLVVTRPRRATQVVEQLPSGHALPVLGNLPESGPVSHYESITRTAKIRSLATSVPDPKLFNPDDLIGEIDELRRGSQWDFYYTEAAGHPELAAAIQGLLAGQGLHVSLSDLLITFGGTHALSLALDALSGSSPGSGPGSGRVLVQEPGPLGLRQLLVTKRMTGVPVRNAGSGIDLDHARSCVARYRPQAMIVSPDFGHATGLRMSLEERLNLVSFARESGLKLIEDGSLAALGLDDDPVVPLAGLAPDITAYVGSFSYTLAPGLRIGYLLAPGAIREKALAAFKAENVSGVGFLQAALARYIGRGAYAAHLRRVVPKYRARRAFVASMRSSMPGHVRWTHPAGGFSSWVTLDHPRGGDDLYKRALRKGVAFSPGSLFILESDPQRQARLSFGLLEPEALRDSVRVLAGLIGVGDGS